MLNQLQLIGNFIFLSFLFYDQGRARFSFMGSKGGSLWKQVTFRLSDQRFE